MKGQKELITMEDWVTIQNMKKRNPSLGTRQIAKLLNLSRNTVKRALDEEKEPRYQREKKVNPELAPFEDYIHERLIIKRLQGSRVLEEIISKGYSGSKSAFYRHTSKLKDPNVRTFQPYETAPGEQLQFDWSEYSIIINDILVKVYVFSALLAFSRYRIYEASLSQTQGSVFEALENSFLELGGLADRIQTDNAKCFVTNASKENLQWNPNYISFCGHYKIKPTRSLPAHPWSKGKVEKPFDYLEQHFIRENHFDSFEDFLRKLKLFQHEVNNRVHSATKQTPLFLFQQERSSLLSLPESRYVNVKELFRKATADCLISFDGSRYSVPYQFALREVWLRVSKGHMLEIYSSQNVLIASHMLSKIKGKMIMNMEHYKNHHIERGNWERMAETFIRAFPGYEWFVRELKTQKRINPAYHLTQIVDIVKYYHPDDCRSAFEMAKSYNIYSSKIIKGYLENRAVHAADSQPVICRLNSNRGDISQQNIKRPMSSYTTGYFTITNKSEKDMQA